MGGQDIDPYEYLKMLVCIAGLSLTTAAVIAVVIKAVIALVRWCIS